jgi:hypothetical protein
MNASGATSSVSGYEGRERWESASVMWDTVDLGRQKVGAESVMEVARPEVARLSRSSAARVSQQIVLATLSTVSDRAGTDRMSSAPSTSGTPIQVKREVEEL